MSKELEALNRIKEEFGCDPAYYDLGEEFEILERAVAPKKYLKWEDLETNPDGVRVDLQVSLNGTKYRLSYFPSDTSLKLLTNDEDFYLEIENEQFFNSLHLEVIEE